MTTTLNTGSIASMGSGSVCAEDAELEIASRAIRALSSPARLRILCLLFDGERSVVELTRLIEGHTQSSISQHLGFLLKSGIVVNRKYKTRMLYRISDERTQTLMRMVVEIFCEGGRRRVDVDGRGIFAAAVAPA